MSEGHSRLLSLHERYSLARRLCGSPPNVSMIVAYPSASSLPSITFLEKRILELQEHFPTLDTRVDDERTIKPRITIRDQLWSPSDILGDGTYEPVEQDEEEQITRLLNTERRDAASEDFDFETEPLWKVTRYVHPTKPDSATAYISMVTDHVLIDGRGLLLLVSALLADDISALPYEKRENVRALENTIDVKPSIRYLLPIVFEKLLLPKLPAFIQNYFHTTPCWPGKEFRGVRSQVDSATSILFLPSDLVSSVKSTAKAHGVKTLHPIIEAAYAAAIWTVWRYTISPFKFIAATPRSERDPSLGHAYCTGNYVSENRITLDLHATDDFWIIAQRIANDLNDPNVRRNDRMAIGMISFIPDGLVVSDKPDPHKPTKWEEFLLEDTSDDKPFEESISVSNVGYARLPPRATDMVWAQTSSRLGPPLAINAVGHEGGMRLTTLFREGTVVIEEEVKEMERVVKDIMEKIARGQQNMTLGVLAKK
ncbi:hypothetical protein IAR55_003052 [Kwoniella newhampshirensis]|uniref:Alcohol acetyltransferase n=1 Tax=Kwoniella newhampshirensis TaxID=1651941 RepID=A0AAW0Z0L9_9TREE